MINFLNWLDGVLWGIPLIVLMLATGIYCGPDFSSSPTLAGS